MSMFCQAYCAALSGTDAVIVKVEADAGGGLPSFELVGYLSSEVKEAKERVRVAIKNAGYALMPKKVTVNLSPADIRKEGTAFDLSIAVSVLAAFEIIPAACLRGRLFLGELSLNGCVNPVSGILPMVSAASRNGIRECYVPKENAMEAAMVEGIRVIGIKTLAQAVDCMLGRETAEPVKTDFQSIYQALAKEGQNSDFADIKGQVLAKRAAVVAAAGFHNLLLIGSPGTGKSMLAKRMAGILPRMDFEECIAVSRIYSVAGGLTEQRPLIVERPFRSPHHTITKTAFTGGGRILKPGELSLASQGILFLDELPEFQRSTIEVLRQPLEDREVTITRLSGSCTYPAGFLLVAAMNPCYCGYYPDRNRCACSRQQIKKYLSRISRPILDRIDICAEVPAVAYRELAEGERADEQQPKPLTTGQIKKQVLKVWEIQKDRFKHKNISYNSQIDPAGMDQYIALGIKEKLLLEKAFHKYQLSARSYHRVLKITRTIADLDNSNEIKTKHIAEALSYRAVDGRIWEGEAYGR